MLKVYFHPMLPGGDRGMGLRIWALALALGLAAPALAESIKTVAPGKPAPPGERRVALVIGNGSYKDAPLRNPVNDARAIARALSDTGFSVTVMEDATQAGMRRAIRNFGDELAKAAVGLFYYAGHGMQVKGNNYLIPVNADIDREDEVADQGVDANLVMAKMDSAKNALNIMILDACRNNPFARSFRSSARGLAQMEAPSGTLISFATAPGSVASDGSGVNGLYTEHFLKAIQQPGLPIEQVFKQVRIGVTRATGDAQIPWESSSLKGDFFFLPPIPGAGGVASQQAVQKAVQEAQRAADERLALEREQFQKRMEQMVQDALARQRAMLEAERKAAGAAPAATAGPAPVPAQAPAAPAAVGTVSAPVQVASLAPAASVASARESVGDRWRYLGADAHNADKKVDLTVEVLGTAGGNVVEVLREVTGPEKQWVYTNVPTLVDGGGPMLVFSPLVASPQPIQLGQTWRNIAIEGLPQCVNANCSAEARVVAQQTVKTAAGSFEAFRVELNFLTSGLGWRQAQRGTINYWYAPEVKRVVKYSARTPARDLDAELAAYRVSGAGSAGSFRD